MDPSAKRSKKKAKKAVFGEGRPAGRAEKQVPTAPTDNHTSWRDEEELVDYESEEPAAFYPIEDDISVPEDHTPVPAAHFEVQLR